MSLPIDMKLVKRRIVSAIKDLDRTDCIDICVLIKSNLHSDSPINETPRGTFVDLDMLDAELLKQLDNMIKTKLIRLSA
jgi:hypothetical protein